MNKEIRYNSKVYIDRFIFWCNQAYNNTDLSNVLRRL